MGIGRRAVETIDRDEVVAGQPGSFHEASVTSPHHIRSKEIGYAMLRERSEDKSRSIYRGAAGMWSGVGASGLTAFWSRPGW